MIEIEIIDLTSSKVIAAFYYTMSPLPLADDQSRVPQGTRLSDQQKQDLKDGSLYEYMYENEATGNMNSLENKLENAYNAHSNKADQEYIDKYGGVGWAYDGNSWS